MGPKRTPDFRASVHRLTASVVGLFVNYLAFRVGSKYDPSGVMPCPPNRKASRRDAKSARAVAMKFKVALLASLFGFVRSSLAQPTVDYARDVKPILAERCFGCHGAI